MKFALALVSVLIGAALIVLGLFGLVIGSVLSFIAFVLLGIAFGLPGLWWLLHAHREKNGAVPLKRHWTAVGAASAVSACAGLAFVGGADAELNTGDATPTTTVVKTSTTTTTSTTKVRVTWTPSSVPEPTPEPIEEKAVDHCGEVGVHETGTTFFTDGTTDWTQQCADQMSAEADRAQQNQQMQGFIAPAPAPASANTYYPNCAAARAAGASPLYAGQPGYRAKLDRDGDGVACE